MLPEEVRDLSPKAGNRRLSNVETLRATIKQLDN
jgi:hypothetical protein